MLRCLPLTNKLVIILWYNMIYTISLLGKFTLPQSLGPRAAWPHLVQVLFSFCSHLSAFFFSISPLITFDIGHLIFYKMLFLGHMHQSLQNTDHSLLVN